MNNDIKEERSKVSFNIDEFTNWYHGGFENLKKKRFIESYFLNDPELQDKIPTSYLSHKEVYEDSIRKVAVLLKKLKMLEAEGNGGPELYSELLGGTYQKYIMREGSPVSVHYDMFIPALKNLGTPQQRDEWLSRSQNCSIIGAYAQTELGHGTFVRGIETTATYDPQTKEFVIDSPTITAYKFWPGGLGQTANYALVFANLITLGKSYGIHGFLVQLRDEVTHKPLKGITIGEIGAKFGFSSVNNGFLGFNNVRIPLRNMMMKNSEVRESGEYKKSKSSILTYGTMTYIRVGIVIDGTNLLANAATIAMRYSTVRRQSPINPNSPEPKIIDHITQQMKIFPVIAKVIVFKKAAEQLWDNYVQVTEELEQGNLEGLASLHAEGKKKVVTPSFHAISCCLKAICTNEVTQAVETCRLACGGHGYLVSAGFSDIYKFVTAAQTYEGENTVLLLQTARYLIKSWNQAVNGKELPPSVKYLEKYIKSGKREQWNGSPEGILRAFEAATAGKLSLAFKHLEHRKKTYSLEEATNLSGIELTKVAEMHCHVYLLQAAFESFNNSIKSVTPTLAKVLGDILELYSIDIALRSLGKLIQFVDITSDDIEILESRLEASLEKLRNNAIGIVDGFDITDTVLQSTIGACDGNVYQRILDAAKKSPLNQENVNKSFHLYLKPFIKSNL